MIPRLLIDPVRGTIQVGEYVYSLAVLARGAVRAANTETCGAATAAGAAAGEVPAGEGTQP